MELTPQILIVVLPLIFLGGFVDSVAGGGGLITLPAYLMAGIPAHLAMGTNKVVNGTGTALASFKYFRGGKVLLRPAIISGIGALLGAAIGTKIALLIPENILKIMMLVALPCAAILLMLKKDFGKESNAPAREYTPKQEMARAALIGLGLGCYDGLSAQRLRCHAQAHAPRFAPAVRAPAVGLSARHSRHARVGGALLERDPRAFEAPRL